MIRRGTNVIITLLNVPENKRHMKYLGTVIDVGDNLILLKGIEHYEKWELAPQSYKVNKWEIDTLFVPINNVLVIKKLPDDFFIIYEGPQKLHMEKEAGEED